MSLCVPTKLNCRFVLLVAFYLLTSPNKMKMGVSASPAATSDTVNGLSESDLARRVSDLTGVWGTVQYGFMWTWAEARIFKRSISDHPHDYWVIRMNGACLDTNVQYAAARFDPVTNTLRFTQIANRSFYGPWTMLWVPNYSDDSYIRVGNDRNGTAGEFHPFLLPNDALTELIRHIPQLYNQSSKKWLDMKVVGSILFNEGWRLDSAMVRKSTDLDVILQANDVGHGVWARPSVLLDLDRQVELPVWPESGALLEL